MDFMGRTVPNQQPARMAAPEPPESPRGKRRDKYDWLTRGSRIGTNALLFIVALLIASVVWLIYSSSPASQSKYVDSTKLQAVFLNTGQVYFGNVTSFNKDYLVLTNVYYLQSSNSNASSSSSSSNQNVSLVKLGCELHKPYDQMVVNTTEVTFWENLQTDGQVAKAVSDYNKQNPTHTCTSTTSNSSANLQNQPSSTSKQ
jgi:hypothetical protein